ncbi:ROK family protein [Microbacterium saperdae]
MRDHREVIRSIIAVDGQIVASDATERLAVTRSTAQRLLDQMLAAGEIRVLPEKSQGGRGRRARRYGLASDLAPVLVYAEAPEHVSVAAIGTGGAELGVARISRFSAGSLAVEDIVALFTEAAAAAGIDPRAAAGAVVGLPGPVPRGAIVTDAAPAPVGGFTSWGSTPPTVRQLQVWGGRHPQSVLAAEFGLTTVIENDGNLAALGEVTAGSARGARSAIALSLVDTTGGGIIVDGSILAGRSGMAGELGHISVRSDGALCPCGNRGCFWAEAGFETLRLELSALVGQSMTPEQIADRVRARDSVFTAALREFGVRVGSLIAGAVSVIDPDVIVVDGALGAAAPVVAAGAREALSRACSPLLAHDLRIVPGALGGTAVFVGGAALFHQTVPHRQVARQRV